MAGTPLRVAGPDLPAGSAVLRLPSCRTASLGADGTRPDRLDRTHGHRRKVDRSEIAIDGTLSVMIRGAGGRSPSSLLVRLRHERDGQDVNNRHAPSPELFQALAARFPCVPSGWA